MKQKLDELLEFYEKSQAENVNSHYEIPRETTDEELDLLSQYLLEDNLQAYYDYYDLKKKLDEDFMMQHFYTP